MVFPNSNICWQIKPAVCAPGILLAPRTGQGISDTWQARHLNLIRQAHKDAYMEKPYHLERVDWWLILPHHLLHADFLLSWFFTQKMEVIYSNETSAHIWTTSTQCFIPDDGNIQRNCLLHHFLWGLRHIKENQAINSSHNFLILYKIWIIYKYKYNTLYIYIYIYIYELGTTGNI
jgi:hypothetical protein